MATKAGRPARIAIAVICGVGLIYSENYLSIPAQKIFQMAILTVTGFSLLASELYFLGKLGSIRRPRQGIIAFILFCLHLYVLYSYRDAFPLRAIAFFIVFLVEVTVIGLLYILLGGRFDPDGPFGPTEAERRKPLPRLF
ncbi:MAG TPA: hypothetical protein VK578_09735 [Edaphobacter sp.]|jgi:hypothetical protein|nr:hypothetical protein [Edaphobacter sp.]